MSKKHQDLQMFGLKLNDDYGWILKLFNLAV